MPFEPTFAKIVERGEVYKIRGNVDRYFSFHYSLTNTDFLHIFIVHQLVHIKRHDFSDIRYFMNRPFT